MFKMLNHPDVGTSYLCEILLPYGAKTNITIDCSEYSYFLH